MIANSDFNLVAYAEPVAELTDDELTDKGKQLRRLVYPKRISGTGRSSFDGFCPTIELALRFLCGHRASGRR